jgi:hypothetical protein
VALGLVKLDDKGFVITGAGAGSAASPFATSLPGIFAVGDVRAGSVKRVASSVGEGSVVISKVWEFVNPDRLHAGVPTRLLAIECDDHVLPQQSGVPRLTHVVKDHVLGLFGAKIAGFFHAPGRFLALVERPIGAAFDHEQAAGRRHDL